MYVTAKYMQNCTAIGKKGQQSNRTILLKLSDRNPKATNFLVTLSYKSLPDIYSI